MTEKSMTDDEILFPTPTIVKARGETFEVLPFNAIKYVRAAKIIKEILPKLTEKDAEGKLMGREVIEIALDCGEELLALVAIGLDKPRSWVEKVSLDELISLSLAIYEQNKEEFVKKAMPRLQELMGGVAEKAPEEQNQMNLDLDSPESSVS